MPDVPENAEWGPACWKVLHGLAEFAGRQTDPNVQRDELRLWNNILTTLHTVLPCKECKDHCILYVKLHPIVIPTNYEELHSYVRIWLYTFHEDVNSRLGKPSFPVNQLQCDYDVMQAFTTLNVIIKRAVNTSAISITEWTKWSNSARMALIMC